MQSLELSLMTLKFNIQCEKYAELAEKYVAAVEEISKLRFELMQPKKSLAQQVADGDVEVRTNFGPWLPSEPKKQFTEQSKQKMSFENWQKCQKTSAGAPYPCNDQCKYCKESYEEYLKQP